ncbi:MAG: hypothetical protein CMP10_20750 [Zetaproteobacteria bacterium]|mgnify:FL=1|nr:hypothetical protein [Pseudobdellovibrionaceae bacterium]
MKNVQDPAAELERPGILKSEPTILVAMPTMTEPVFEKTVMLLIEHNLDGAMGVILNRPTETSMSSLMLESHLEIPEAIPTWFGGPLATDNGLVLHNNGEPITTLGSITLSATKEDLENLVGYNVNLAGETGEYLYPYRFLAGYAGWGPGQLEDEMKQGAWFQIALDMDLLFNTKADSMWATSTNSLGITSGQLTSMNHEYLI